MDGEGDLFVWVCVVLLVVLIVVVFDLYVNVM